MLPDRFMSLAALLSVLAMPALAQDTPEEPTENDFTLACAFVLECLDAEPCAETAYEMAIAGREGGLGAGAVLTRATLSSVSGDVETFGTRTGTTLFLQGGRGAARHYLTVTDGAARYTVHMASGPVAITYHGSCE